MYNDVSELCVAVLVTFCVAYSWIALVFAFPFITLLQRSVRHARLLAGRARRLQDGPAERGDLGARRDGGGGPGGADQDPAGAWPCSTSTGSR